MRGIDEVKKSSDPGDTQKVLILALVPLFLILIFASGFVDPRTMTDQRLAKALYKIQLMDAKLFLNPVALHPWIAFLLAALASYSINFYALLRDAFTTHKEEPRPDVFRTEHLRWLSLYAVPAASFCTIATVEVSLLLFASRQNMMRLWSFVVLFGFLAVLVVLGFSYSALRRTPHTVKDISKSPDLFDISDLSGAAHVKDLPDLLIKSELWPQSNLKDRLVIGRFWEDNKKTSWWVAPHHPHLNQTVVIAPPGSGKTFSIALPMSRTLPQLGQSVFAIDIKGNMRPKLQAYCDSSHVVMHYFDPTNHDESLHWNPFEEINKKDLIELHNGRDRLAEAIFGEVAQGPNSYFDLRDLRFIKAGIELLLFQEKDPTLKDLYELFLSQDGLQQSVKKLLRTRNQLQRTKTLTPQDARFYQAVEADLAALVKQEEQKDQSFSELIQGVRNKLEPLGHPAITAITDASYIPARDAEGNPIKEASGSLDRSKAGPFGLGLLTKEPSLFICSTPMELGLLGSSIAAIMVRMIQHTMTKRFKTANPQKRLYLILDEFSKLRMNPSQVEHFISTSREAACVSVVVLQDITQIQEEIRLSLLSNCKDVYLLRGAGPATADWFNKALDTRRRLLASITENQSDGTKSSSSALSASISEQWVPVLRPREIRNTGNLRYGAWLLLDHYSDKPILVDLQRTE